MKKQLNEKVAPIAYASCTLQPHKKTHGISELEVLAVFCQKLPNIFRTYLYRHPCDVITGREALQGLLNI